MITTLSASIQQHQKMYDHLYQSVPKYGTSEIRISFVKPLLEQISFRNVLDVGAGVGQMIRWIISVWKDIEVKGIELSPVALQRAKDLVDAGILHHGSVQNIPWDASSFDLVLCTDVLEHIPESELDMSMREIYRVTRRFVVITTDVNPAIEQIHMIGPYKGMRVHEVLRPGRWWKEQAEKCGFQTLKFIDGRKVALLLEKPLEN